MSTKKQNWSPMLREWEGRYGELYEDAILAVAALSWEECEALREEIKLVGQGNCSWWLYHAARDLLWSALPRDEEGLELLRRNADEIRSERGVAV